MIHFIAKRLLHGFSMLISVSLLAFFLLSLGTGNVARLILGVQATAEQVTELNTQLGLDRSLFERFTDWLSNAIFLDFGASWSMPESVNEVLFPRLFVTLTIVGITTVITAVLSIVLGTLAAVRGGRIDRFIQVFSLLGFSIPGFLVAFFLVNIFAINFQIFNAVGYTNFSESPSEWIKSITLPVLALSMSAIASTSQQVRGAVKDALNMDYVRTLRARGLSSKRVLFRHVLRNAAGPALAILGVQFVGMLGGAVLVEQIFAIPGLGPFAVTSTAMSDIPSIMGLVVATALVVIIVNLVIDLITVALNPKVRLS
jgi:peptide/nickel transport system permease protein